MQGSEQNMGSLPPRHRSIAICNPSPGSPPMTASRAMSSQIIGRPLTGRAGDQPGLRSLSVHPTSPSSRLRLASHLATTAGPQLALTPCHTNLMCPFRWQSHSSSSSRKRSKTTTISPPPRSFRPSSSLSPLPALSCLCLPPPPPITLPMTDQDRETHCHTDGMSLHPPSPPFIPSLTISKTKKIQRRYRATLGPGGQLTRISITVIIIIHSFAPTLLPGPPVKPCLILLVACKMVWKPYVRASPIRRTQTD